MKNKRRLQLYLMAAVMLLGTFSGRLSVNAAETKSGGQNQSMTTAPVSRTRIYYVREGECLSSIAKEMYGDSSYWIKIYAANKETIGDNPDYLQAYTYLELPEAPEKGLVWNEIYDKTWQSYEFDIFDAYIEEDLPYQIEEYCYYRNAEDEKYGDWEQNVGKFNVHYPQLKSLDGRDMTQINETIKEYSMGIVKLLYADPYDEVKNYVAVNKYRDFIWCTDTGRYQITYMDESLLCIVFEHYYNYGSVITLTDERHMLESLIINLETGHVYETDELFCNTKQLAAGQYERILQNYPEYGDTYTYLDCHVDENIVEDTLNTAGWVNGAHKTEVFLDKEGVNLAFNYDVYLDYQGWEGFWWDYEVTHFSDEEIMKYQSDSDLWKKWN